jgi:Mg-chelatase subunit ChlD
MSLPKGTAAQKEEEELRAISKEAGIYSRMITPSKRSPPATASSARLRAELDRVRMRMRRKLLQDGEEVDAEALIAAMLEEELDDAPLFETRKREGGLDLLLLVDVSGSMVGIGMLFVDQAVADVQHACADERVRVHLWAFSDELYLFKKTGSVQTPEIRMGGTQMVQALEVAHRWCLQGRRERALMLVTDGEPTSCRAHDSKGTPLDDLHAMLSEMEQDRVVFSILAIGSSAMEARYETVFGKGKYARIASINDMVEALPKACKVLVEAHIQRTM